MTMPAATGMGSGFTADTRFCIHAQAGVTQGFACLHKYGAREVLHECIPVGMGVILACRHAQAHACVKETLGGAVCHAQVLSRSAGHTNARGILENQQGQTVKTSL